MEYRGILWNLSIFRTKIPEVAFSGSGICAAVQVCCERQNSLFESSEVQGETCLSPYSFRVSLIFVLITNLFIKRFL